MLAYFEVRVDFYEVEAVKGLRGESHKMERNDNFAPHLKVPPEVTDHVAK